MYNQIDNPNQAPQEQQPRKSKDGRKKGQGFVAYQEITYIFGEGYYIAGEWVEPNSPTARWLGVDDESFVQNYIDKH